MMDRLSDQEYLRTEQYRDSANLSARAALHRLFSINKQGWVRWVFDQFDLPPKCRLLDIGCGPGNLWDANLSRIPGGWDITLSDFSPGMVQEAKKCLRTASRSQPFKFAIADAQAIPFANAQFDAVTALLMLHHVPDLAKALAEIRRVLRPGGRLYAATNGNDHMRELFGLVRRFDASLWGGPPVLGFSLEAGHEALAPWFAEVTLHRYEDALVVTEVEPLVAYVASSVTMGSLAEADEKRAAFTEYVTDELARHGAILITKASGLFEARRA